MGEIVMFTTSTQNSKLSPYARIMFLTHFIIILFACFVTLFCCGEYGALACHWISHSPKKASNFLNTNSQIHFTLMRFWFSSLFCSPLKCLVFFEFIKHFSFDLQKINICFLSKNCQWMLQIIVLHHVTMLFALAHTPIYAPTHKAPKLSLFLP